MIGYELYRKYVAMKAHFNNAKFDIRKYPFVKNTTTDSFYRRNDSFMFDRVAKQLFSDKEIVDYLKANFVETSSFWIGDEFGFEIYVAWQARNHNIAYTIKKDIGNIAHWKSNQQRPPSWSEIFFSNRFKQMFLRKMIAVETFVIFNNMFQLFDYYSENCDDFLWQERVLALHKYATFYENVISPDDVKSIIRMYN